MFRLLSKAGESHCLKWLKLIRWINKVLIGKGVQEGNRSVKAKKRWLFPENRAYVATSLGRPLTVFKQSRCKFNITTVKSLYRFSGKLINHTFLLKQWDWSWIMLATRTLLSKQTLAVLSRQPACFVHHGDYGNWGNTNIAVVSETYEYGSGEIISVGILVICESLMCSRFSQDVAGGMGLMSTRESSEYHSCWAQDGTSHTIKWAPCWDSNSLLLSPAPCTTWAATVLASRCLLRINSRCMWWTTWESSPPLGKTGRLVQKNGSTVSKVSYLTLYVHTPDLTNSRR